MGLVNALREAGYAVTESTVRRWAYPEEKNGTGGVVPTRAWAGIQAAAKMNGLVLTSVDFDFRPLKVALVLRDPNESLIVPRHEQRATPGKPLK